MARGSRVAIVGGSGSIAAMARAAVQLQAGAGTDHPELLAFTSWDEVQRFAREDEGKDLAPFVRLVDAHGPVVILDACSRLAEEDGADLIVSTAHKAKGREWASVTVGDDFLVTRGEQDEARMPGRDELMLAYVTVTRARYSLNRGSLAFIDSLAPKVTGPETGLDDDE
jgi:hypothetical protein